MIHSVKNEQLIKQILTSAKTIAMVGLSSIILDEAAVMGRPSLSVLPRTIERGWLAGHPDERGAEVSVRSEGLDCAARPAGRGAARADP